MKSFFKILVFYSLFFLNTCFADTALRHWSEYTCDFNDSDEYRKNVLEKALQATYQKWLDAAALQHKNILHYIVDKFETVFSDMDFKFLLESVKYVLHRNGSLLKEQVDNKPLVLYTLEKYKDKDFVNELVIFFLKQGADPNSCDALGWTLLHYAAVSGNFNLAEILIEEYKANVNVMTLKQFVTPLHIVCARGDIKIFDLLMNNKVCAGMRSITKANALHFACGKALMVKNGKFAFGIDSFGPFYQENKLLYEKQLHFRNHMVERLIIEKGLNCIEHDSFGFTAFDYAEKFGNDLLCQTMRRLCKVTRYASDEDYESWYTCAKDFGMTVLQYVFALCENDLTLEQLDFVCQGLESLLKKHKEFVNELIDKKEPIYYLIDKYSERFWVRSVAEILLQNGANPDSCDDNDWSILHSAIKAGRYELFKSIANFHADLNVFTKKEKISLLHLACFYGNKEIFDFLLDHKVNVSFADINGDTALHFVAGCGYYDEEGKCEQILPSASKVNVSNQKFYQEQINIRKYMIKRLHFEAGASYLIDDKGGLSAKDFAYAFGHDELFAYFSKQ